MKQIIIIYLLFFFFTGFGQSMDTINWRDSYRLNWNDFKAAPERGGEKCAITGASISYHAESKGNEIICNVQCYFNRQRSWVKPEFKNDYVLRHEQGHFDLFEVYTRMLRKTLQEKTFKRKKLTNDLKKTINKVIKKAEAQQEKYDKATSYSFREVNQRKWSTKISEELKSLDKYKISEFKLNIK